MSKRIWIWIGLLVIISASIYVYGKAYDYYTPAQTPLTSYRVHHHHDDTLRIAYIGDSWAFFHQRHSCQIEPIISDSLHISVKIMSAGACGAPSKCVFSRMGADGMIRKTLDNAPDYCILSAGINDTQLKLGKDYYKQNMKLMIRFFLENGITPIVIEIPDYDIHKQYKELKLPKKIFRWISMGITKCSMDCLDEFRQTLNMMLIEENYHHQTLILRKTAWETTNWGLYMKDRLHPNDDGYAVMDTCLANMIIQHIKKTREEQKK